ncbi:MAG: acyltransferase, partial [Acidimicrobiia bacterium]|nr:acyltransferase [Acidimicrobiia bacterium]
LYVLNWLPAWMDMFALGMGLAVASAGADIAGVGRRVPAAIGRHPALCWTVAGAAFWAVSTRLGLPNHTAVLDAGQELGQHYLYGLMGLCVVLPAVFGDQRQGAIRAVLRSRVAVAVGVVSYGIYLWHIALIERITKYVHVSGFSGFLVLAALGLAASYCVALVSYVAVERPALRLKGRPAPAPAPASA